MNLNTLPHTTPPGDVGGISVYLTSLAECPLPSIRNVAGQTARRDALREEIGDLFGRWKTLRLCTYQKHGVTLRQLRNAVARRLGVDQDSIHYTLIRNDLLAFTADDDVPLAWVVDDDAPHSPEMEHAPRAIVALLDEGSEALQQADDETPSIATPAASIATPPGRDQGLLQPLSTYLALGLREQGLEVSGVQPKQDGPCSPVDLAPAEMPVGGRPPLDDPDAPCACPWPSVVMNHGHGADCAWQPTGDPDALRVGNFFAQAYFEMYLDDLAQEAADGWHFNRTEEAL